MKITDIEILINTLTDGGINRANKVRNIFNAIKDEAIKINELKEIALLNSDISIFFDNTGLGKVGNTYDGFAICNGQNGTWDISGRVTLAYDITNYSILGDIGGEKTHALDITEIAPHDHDIAYDGHNASSGGSEWTLDNGGGATGTTKTKKAGGDSATHTTVVPHNNMQPYIVVLKIQRIA